MSKSVLTEAEWLSPIDVVRAYHYARGGMSPRKQLLFACACSRTDPEFVDDNRIRVCTQTAELIADDQAIVDPYEPVRELLRLSPRAGISEWIRAYVPHAQLLVPEPNFEWFLVWRIEQTTRKRRSGEMGYLKCLRDIVGNPFRAFSFDDRWCSPDTLGLARAIYEDRAFDRLPILADALMDAGCDDDQILAHCRSAGPHVRGCWVVDLVLGKT